MQGGSTARLGIVFDVPNAAMAAQSLNQVAMAADNVADNAAQASLRTNALAQAMAAPRQTSAQLAAQITGVNQGLVEFISRLDRSSESAIRAARSWQTASQAIKQGLAGSFAEFTAAFDALEGRLTRFGQNGQMRQFNPMTANALQSGGGSGGGNDFDTIDRGARRAAGGFNLLEASVQGVAGGLAFFAANAVVSAVAGLAQLPFAAARAEDSLAKLQARLRFAFRGSDAAARVGGASIMGIADDLGMDYNALAQQYGDMAISGRAMGMSSGQVGGAVESFGRLGMISGANQAQINGAMWQVQQMMNLGVLRFQDYRYMATNMGALDDVLAKGAGVPVSQLMNMISNGEVSAEKFFQYLERGMAELERQAMTAPETIERSSARMQNAWTRMLQDMGEAIQASNMVQAMHNLITEAIDNTRRTFFADALERGELARQGRLPLSQSGEVIGLIMQGVDPNQARQIVIDRNAQAAQRAVSVDGFGDRAAAYFDENLNSAEAQYEAGLGSIASLRTTEAQRGQVQSEINRVRAAIDRIPQLVAAYQNDPTTGLDPVTAAESAQRLQIGLQTFEAQLAAIVDPFTRALQQQGAAESNFARGGSRGSDLLNRAYEMSMAQAGTLEQPSQQAALGLILRQEALGVRGQQSQTLSQLNAQRQFVLPAIGQDARAMAQAQVEAEITALRETYGDLANDPRVQEIIRIRREMLEGQNALDADVALARAQDQASRQMARIQAALDTVGDPVARRREMERLDAEEAERQNPGMRDTTRGLQAQQNALSRAERVEEGARRRREMQEEVDITMGLGRERRVYLEILRLERQERAAGAVISREEAEREARRNVEAQEQFEIRSNWINSLERSGRRLGEGLENTFFSSIRQGFRRGRIEAEDVLWSLADIALDIGEDIVRNLTAPWRRSISEAGTNFFTRFLENLIPGFSGGGGKGKLPGKKSAFGNAFDGMAIIPHSMGGVTASMGYFPMANGGIGSLAEAGAEAILPLARGPDGRLGVQNTGDGGGVQIIVNDQRGADAEPVEVQERRGPDGRRMVEMTLRDSQRKNVAAGKTDGAMRSRYGAQPLVRQA